MFGLTDTHDSCLAASAVAKRRWPNCKAVFAAVLLLAAAGPVLANTARKDIKDYFAALPEVVFDKTTFGLTEEQHKEVLEKGKNEDWTFKRIHAGKATLTGIDPASVVTMRLMDLERPVLQVHIQNGRNEDIYYWQFDATGKKLKGFLPSLVLQAAAAAVHDLEFNGHANPALVVNPLSGVPVELVDHIDAVDACRILSGPSRSVLPPRDLAKRLKVHQCDKRGFIEAQLRRKHSKLPVAKAILDRAKSLR